MKRLASPFGASPQVLESRLEAYAVVVAMGPTYLWPQLYTLKTLAESWSLESAEAMAAIEAMACGCTAAMKQSGLSQEEVMDLIPARPPAENVEALVEAYRGKLGALYRKLSA